MNKIYKIVFRREVYFSWFAETCKYMFCGHFLHCLYNK